jgi:hypothetical protein
MNSNDTETWLTYRVVARLSLDKIRKQARHDDINITRRYINYSSEVYEKSYHETFAKEIQQDKPQPEKKPEPKKPKPQDTYIAQPQQEISISQEEYKKFLEWKKQQDLMYQ